MKISRITEIVPDGTYNSPHGLLYQFYVKFEDGGEGQANAKSDPPPYREGDEVGYEVTGNYRGGDKIKITRNPDRQGGYSGASGGQQSRGGYQSRPQSQPPRQGQGNSQYAAPAINGATVGMAVKAAVDIWLKVNGGKGEAWDAKALASVGQTARQIVALSQQIEKGAPTAQAAAPNPNTRNYAPDPAPREQETLDEDVPF